MEEVIAEAQKEEHYTLLLDTPTDTGNYCELAVWIRYWKRKGRKRRRRGKMVSRILCVRRIGLNGETAEEVKNMLLETKDSFHLDRKKLSAVGTDGASSMLEKGED
jgi:hypothetical protein